MKRLLGTALLLAAMACRTADDEARVGVGFQSATGVPLTVQDLDVRLTESGVTYELATSEIGTTANQPRIFDTGTAGTLRVQFALGKTGAPAGEGMVELPLRGNWRWGITIGISNQDPTIGCFGCFGAQSFPLAPQYQRTPADSLWVHWGGNKIKDPVIY